MEILDFRVSVFPGETLLKTVYYVNIMAAPKNPRRGPTPQRAPKNPNTAKATAKGKEIAEIRKEIRAENARKRGNHLPLYEDGRKLAYNIARYVHRQHEAEEPCTKAGMAIACGTSSDALLDYGNGLRDGIEIESEDLYIDQIEDEETLALYLYLTNNAQGFCRVTLSGVMKMANEILYNEREMRLYKQGRVADIFALKAQDGWQDDKTPHTVNQTLVINGSEQSAESALAQLGFGRLTDGK